jgi:hypothetical protein
MDMIELTCLTCNNTFERANKEHKRNLKKGRRPFCSLSCSAQYLNSHGERNPKGYSENLRKGSSSDELTPFRWFATRSRQRKQHQNDLKPEYLKRLWEEQKGICPYLKRSMILELSGYKRGNITPLHASLDRIDSSKGYIEGNVEFISVCVNFMKSSFSRQQVLDILNTFKSS